MKIIVIGGGAAGFFSALAAKESNPEAEVILLERTAKLLSKVRISGGGRCNVTHACFDPKKLIQNYPRGSKELLGPFNQFQPKDTIKWFEDRGVELKVEKDGRMFPVTDSSETIIECLMQEAKRLGVVIETMTKLTGIVKDDTGFRLTVGDDSRTADRVILASGSARAGWEFAENFGHTIVPPVPSLFTFNIPDFPLIDLAGVSTESARLKIEGSRFEQAGPLLITHWGFSGPAALKLSAIAARLLAEKEYEVQLIIDWVPELSDDMLRTFFEQARKDHGTKQLKNIKPESIPSSLWKTLRLRAGLSLDLIFNGLSKAHLSRLIETLKRDRYKVSGKTTNKEEFVTAGGVALSEIDFRTMESKRCSGLFFCGEILDIDGVTGGFNFQNAWTTGWIAGRSAALKN